MKPFKAILTSALTFAIIILIFIALPVSSALAYTDGPYHAGSGSNGTGTGTEAWTDPGNITAPGAPYAYVTLYHLHIYSNYLQGTQYGFNIPADATITGIEVNINRMSESRNPNVVDNVVSLEKDGSIVGDNKADLVTAWPTVFTVATYGGEGDLWGTTWLASDINSPDFGVALAANRDNNGNNSRQAVVDSMQITVYYSYTSSLAISCGDGSAVPYGDSVACVATVTHLSGDPTPSGTVNWSSDSSGSFVPNPCQLSDVDGVATCTAVYTPSGVDGGTHGITADYSGDTFYTPSSTYGEVTVEQLSVTVNADPQSKVFGEPDPVFTYSYTPTLAFNDVFTGTLIRDPGEDAGQYTINQGNLALTDNYELNYVGEYLTISRAEPICVIDGYNGVYDGNPHGATGTCSGVFSEPLEGLDLGGSYTEAPGGTVNWSFSDVTGNYTDANGSVEIVIDLAEALCDILGYSGVYDADYHGATGICSGIGDEDPGTLNLGESFKDVPGGTASWTFTGNGNYNDQSGEVEILISSTDALCEISGFDGVYDSTYHGATGTCSGIGSEDPGILDLGETFKDVPGGTASWTFAGNSNYNDQSGEVGIVISPADALCDISGYSGVYDAAYHGASGACSGIGGEDPGTLDLGETFKDVPGGTASWTFTGNGNYHDQSGEVGIVINRAEAVCEISGYSGVYDAAFHGATGSCSGIGGEDPGTLNLGEIFRDVPGGTASWILAGSGNYNDQSGEVEIVITKAEAVCVVEGYVVEYDRQIHTAEGNCSGVLGEPLIGLDLSGTAHTEIASYPDDPWIFSDVTGNYDGVTGTVSDEITRRAITIVADAQSKVYGQTDPELTFQVTVGSLLSGDAFSGNLVRVEGESVGTYAILLGSLSLPDYYEITYAGAIFTIIGFRYLYPLMLSDSGLR